MHANTLSQAKYYLKTQNGVSESYYSHQSTPVYGNGQGAGDSPSQWSQESAMLFQIYKEMMAGATMSDRHGNVIVEAHMAAFADDTNLFGNNDKNTTNKEELVQILKSAFTTWNQLLHTTGHSMELSKCACYLSFWEFQEDGYAFTVTPERHGQAIHVNDINGSEEKIPQLQSNDAQKLLGVMKCPIGDQQAEITRLKTKSDNFALRINSNSITRMDAKLAYEVFYIPAMRYSLNITSINQADMETIQSKATLAFLAAQGYNRHFPREIVFAPLLYQGVGMRHLYDLQGSDCTRLLVQELNQKDTMTQKMLSSLLEVIQMEAGIGAPILEDCRTLEYIEWGWIPQIRDFLLHVDGKVLNASETPRLYRENDCYLMDAPYLQQ
jgi:hypothetical protein